MGLKDIAALAVQADDAERKKQRAINWRTHAEAAEEAVRQHLELAGRCVKAHNWSPEEKAAEWRKQWPKDDPKPHGWGDQAVVLIEDEDMVLTIRVSHESHDTRANPYRSTFGPLEWRFDVTHIDGIELVYGDEACYKSKPSMRWGDVKFIKSRSAYDRTPPINRVASLADVGRLIAAWEKFQAERAAALAQ